MSTDCAEPGSHLEEPHTRRLLTRARCQRCKRSLFAGNYPHFVFSKTTHFSHIHYPGQNPPSAAHSRPQRSGRIGGDERHSRPGRHQHGDQQECGQHDPIRNRSLHYGHSQRRRSSCAGRQHTRTVSAQQRQEHSIRGAQHAAAHGTCGYVGRAAASDDDFGVPERSGRVHSEACHGAVVCADQCAEYSGDDEGVVGEFTCHIICDYSF